MKKSTWLHLRVPFSFFLLPVYLFALTMVREVHSGSAVAMFVILHFLLYPASNGYNSYFDRDEESIGGLENPPKVTRELYQISLLLDVLAILWGLLIRWEVAIMLLIYGLVSKAYSHPMVRLKKYPVTGWMAAGIFQGAFTFCAVYLAVNQQASTGLMSFPVILAALLTTFLLWGSYPMTQVYQHREDRRRGDLTLSRKLGIRGTFIFTAILFLLADAGFIFFFFRYQSQFMAWMFQLALLPVLGFFLWWLWRVWKDPAQADFKNTMRLNFISATCLNLFFGGWLLLQ